MLAPAQPLPPVKHKGIGPIKSRPIVFYDQETLGFGKLQPIIEVAALKWYPQSDRTEEFIAKLEVTPWQADQAEQGAVALTGFTIDEWNGAAHRGESLRYVYNLLAGSVVVAFNVIGDIKRLESEFWGPGAFDFAEDKGGAAPGLPRWWCMPHDLSHTCRLLFPGWPAWNLDEACRQLDIPEEDKHRAYGGAMRTKKVWERIASKVA